MSHATAPRKSRMPPKEFRCIMELRGRNLKGSGCLSKIYLGGKVPVWATHCSPSTKQEEMKKNTHFCKCQVPKTGSFFTPSDIGCTFNQKTMTVQRKLGGVKCIRTIHCTIAPHHPRRQHCKASQNRTPPFWKFPHDPPDGRASTGRVSSRFFGLGSSAVAVHGMCCKCDSSFPMGFKIYLGFGETVDANKKN